MDLGERRISEQGTAFVTTVSRCHVTGRGIGRTVEHVAVTAGGQNDRVGGVPLDLSGEHVPHDDALRHAVARARPHADAPAHGARVVGAYRRPDGPDREARHLKFGDAVQRLLPPGGLVGVTGDRIRAPLDEIVRRRQGE